MVPNENDEMLLMESEEDQEMFLQEIQNDASTHEVIDLPTLEDVNDALVYKNVKDVCRGFSFDANEAMEKKFQNAEQLANYIESIEVDIKQMCHRAETNVRLHNAAAMARYWYMAYSIDKALTSGDYGTNICKQIAARLRRSEPLIYSIRHVGARLTVSQCYLLGIRMVSASSLRILAGMKDADSRNGIIQAFLNAYNNTENPEECERIKSQFTKALKDGVDPKFLLTCTSDPVAGGTGVQVSDLYSNVMKQFKSLDKLLKRVNKEKSLEDFCKACADFSITDSIPDAEEHVESIKEEAASLKVKCQAAKNNLDDIIQELDSMSGVEVISNEGTNGSSNK